jgi:hypothetical protein
LLAKNAAREASEKREKTPTSAPSKISASSKKAKEVVPSSYSEEEDIEVIKARKQVCEGG